MTDAAPLEAVGRGRTKAPSGRTILQVKAGEEEGGGGHLIDLSQELGHLHIQVTVAGQTCHILNATHLEWTPARTCVLTSAHLKSTA
jgi:hypothetical protein